VQVTVAYKKPSFEAMSAGLNTCTSPGDVLRHVLRLSPLWHMFG